MDDLLRHPGDHWLPRSLGSGLVSTAVDVAVLLVAVHALGLRTVPASTLGVVAGCAVSFMLNKYVAFRDGGSPLLPQLGKYAATVVAATLVHVSLMGTLVDHLHVPLLPAKLLCDLLVFTCGCLLVMRLFIFRQRPALVPDR
ncbi:MAG TPA: GtrA family protein [Myxococcales bacterium]|jgi:putative flippase GtrA